MFIRFDVDVGSTYLYSIFEDRLKTGLISFRIDSLNPDEIGWFGWDSGYGDKSEGHGPTLRVLIEDQRQALV